MIIDRSEESDRMRLLFFFKQKTAYEMRISDWSSDVCSSDLEQGDYDATLIGEYVRSRNGSQTGVIIAGPGELFYTPGETEDPFSFRRGLSNDQPDYNNRDTYSITLTQNLDSHVGEITSLTQYHEYESDMDSDTTPTTQHLHPPRTHK